MLLAAPGWRARRRPQPVRRRHALHPRPDARRRRAAPALGAARRHRRRRDAGGPRGPVPLRRRDVAVPIKPSHGVDALYAPRRTVLDPVLVDAAAAPAPRSLWRDGHRRAARPAWPGRRRRRPRRLGPSARHRRRRSSSVPMACAPPSHGVAARSSGTALEPARVVYGYWSGWRRRLRVGLPPGACAGVIPTNGGLACVFAGARLPDRTGRAVRAGVRAAPSVPGDVQPACRRRDVGSRRADLPGSPGVPCVGVGSRLGARR